MPDKAVETFRLSWPHRLRDVAYLLGGELLLLFLLAAWGPASWRVLTDLYWLWLSLSAAVCLLVLAGTRLVLRQEGLGLATWGVIWRCLPFGGLRRLRILRSGATLAALAEYADGSWRSWRRAGLADAGGLADALREKLAGRIDRELKPTYGTRRGEVWTIGETRIACTGPARSCVWTPADLQGIKFLFAEGEDLPIRAYLFPADGGPVRSIGTGTSFFPFLAADLLRFARAGGVKVHCSDLGKDRPRLGRRADEPRAAARRPWLEEGWR